MVDEEMNMQNLMMKDLDQGYLFLSSVFKFL
jgi:hypothetical protein